MLKNLNKILEADCKFISDKCQTLLPALAGKKILITGGTGFFGKNLIHGLAEINKNLDQPVKVTVLSRNLPNIDSFLDISARKNFNFVQGNMAEPIKLESTFDYIINAAVPSSYELRNDDPQLNYQIITQGAKNIINFASKNPNSKILYISSGVVYDPIAKNKTEFAETDPCTEATEINASTFPSTCKIRAEKLHYEEATNPFVIARCFTFSGIYLPLDSVFAFGNFIDDVLNKRDIRIKRDGLSLRSYMYSADLIVWLLFCLVNGKAKEVYNVGSDQAYSIKELAEAMLKISESKNKLVIENRADIKPSSVYIPSIKKARDELKLEIWQNLEQCIRRSLNWHLERQEHEA